MQPYRHSTVRRLQAGVSNIQIMIGVLISAILIMGGVAMFAQFDRAKVDNEVRELARLKKKTASLGAQRGNFSGVTLQTVAALDFFDTKALFGPVGSRVVQNQWSGTVDVTGENFAGVWDALRFRYTGVSTAACKQLGLQAGPVAAGIFLGGNWVKTTVALGGTGTVNLGSLITACDQGANNVTIDFYLTK